MVTINEKIKEFRERNNFTQEYVGCKLGMSQQAYQKIENGTTELKLEMLLILSKLYNVGSHEFIGNVDSELQEIFDQKNNEIINLKNEIQRLKENINFLQNELLNVIEKNNLNKLIK